HRELRTFGRPERELASRRVADENDAFAIERVALDELAYESHRGRHVDAGAGPGAVDVAAASVLHVPGCDTGLAKRDAHVACVDQVVGRLPPAAVNDDRERPEAVDAGQAQVAEMLRLGAVGGARVRDGWGRDDVEVCAVWLTCVDRRA